MFSFKKNSFMKLFNIIQQYYLINMCLYFVGKLIEKIFSINVSSISVFIQVFLNDNWKQLKRFEKKKLSKCSWNTTLFHTLAII